MTDQPAGLWLKIRQTGKFATISELFLVPVKYRLPLRGRGDLVKMLPIDKQAHVYNHVTCISYWLLRLECVAFGADSAY